jgi:hypothetical protein
VPEVQEEESSAVPEVQEEVIESYTAPEVQEEVTVPYAVSEAGDNRTLELLTHIQNLMQKVDTLQQQIENQTKPRYPTLHLIRTFFTSLCNGERSKDCEGN